MEIMILTGLLLWNLSKPSVIIEITTITNIQKGEPVMNEISAVTIIVAVIIACAIIHFFKKLFR